MMNNHIINLTHRRLTTLRLKTHRQFTDNEHQEEQSNKNKIRMEGGFITSDSKSTQHNTDQNVCVVNLMISILLCAISSHSHVHRLLPPLSSVPSSVIVIAMIDEKLNDLSWFPSSRLKSYEREREREEREKRERRERERGRTQPRMEEIQRTRINMNNHIINLTHRRLTTLRLKTHRQIHRQ